MTKTALVPIGLGNPDKPDDDPVYLEVGDEVPSWAEKHIKPEYLSENEVVAAGTNLYSDHVYQVVRQVAEDKGMDVPDDWSPDQIAAAIRLKEHTDDLEQRAADGSLDEDDVEDAVSSSEAAMADLFGNTNEAGNVNAPDQESKSKSASKSSASKSTAGGSGGSQS